MANKRLNRPVIVACLLSATVALSSCSPPLPKTWLPPLDGAMSIGRLHVMIATPLTPRP
jgi:hypothetical protein